MIYFILLIVYILSYLLCWWTARLCSSKYYDLWLNEDCQFEIWWIFPIFNTFVGVIIFLLTLKDINKFKIKYPKCKLLNTDL
jgi:hypothetical protein